MWTFQLTWAGLVLGLVSSQVLNEYINPFWLGSSFDRLDRDSYRRGKSSPYGYRYNNYNKNNDDYYFARGGLYQPQGGFYRSNRFDYIKNPFYNQDYRRYRDPGYLRRQPDIYSDDMRRYQQLMAARADAYRNYPLPDPMTEMPYTEANPPRYNLQIMTDGTQPQMLTDGTQQQMLTDGTQQQMLTDGTLPQMQSLGLDVRQRLTRSDKKQLAH